MTSGPAEGLPQLEMVRQTAVMRRIFEIAMPDQNIRDCAVLNVRYKPGGSCLVVYRLTRAQNGAAEPESQIVSARFYPPGRSLSRFVKAQRATLAPPAFGEPIFHVPDLDAVVWAFPNDRMLPGVPALIDEDRIAREVAPVLAGRAACLQSVEVFRYVPEHGCTVKVTVRADDDGRPLVFYGKTYAGEAGEETYRNMSALWNGVARARGTLQMAQPLMYEPAHRALWQSAVEGPELASLEASGPEFLPLLQAAGRAVAALHSERVPGLQRVTAADLHTGLQEAELRLRHVGPLANRVSSVTAQLLEQTPDFGARPMATLHGDLHAKNIISTGGPAALIDLDTLRAGDPLQDLGSFVASTCARALAHEIGASDIAPMVAALVGAYEAGAPWDVPRRALRWHTAAALMAEQAYRTMIHMKIASLDALLDVAQQALSGDGLMKVLL